MHKHTMTLDHWRTSSLAEALGFSEHEAENIKTAVRCHDELLDLLYAIKKSLDGTIPYQKLIINNLDAALKKAGV